MQHTVLGHTGMRVSRLALGTALIGLVPEEAESVRLVHAAIDAGINVLDCANTYGNRAAFDRPGMPGHEQRKAAEVILGEALKGRRDDVIVCTKVAEPIGTGVNDGVDRRGGLSRFHVLREVERSLRRLGTDHIDVYHAHHPDPDTPIEETIHVFDDLVRQGKVRYWALSNFNGWQLTEALLRCDIAGLPRPVVNQIHYNMLARGPERDVQPAAVALGLPLSCYSPLAGGTLAGARTLTKEYSGVRRWTGGEREQPQSHVEAAMKLDDLASAWGSPPAHLALHWLLGRPAVAMAVIGPESIDELHQTIGAVDVALDPAQEAALDEVGLAALAQV